MNKTFIAALAIMMTAPNISATTMPLNHAEPIEAANVNTMKIEQSTRYWRPDKGKSDRYIHG